MADDAAAQKTVNILPDTGINSNYSLKVQGKFAFLCDNDKQVEINDTVIEIKEKKQLEVIRRQWRFVYADSMKHSLIYMGSATPDFYLYVYKNGELYNTLSIYRR